MNPRIAILHCTTGNGHVSAALAVEATLRSQGLTPSCEDSLDYAPQLFRLWYAGGYETIVRQRKESWGWLYRISDHPRAAYKIQTWMDRNFLRRLRGNLLRMRPDVVLTTHSLPQPILEEVRASIGCKIAVIVTDLYPHLMWLRGKPDAFYVPTEWSRLELIERATWSADQIEVTGIPVHPAFSALADQDRSLLKSELGLPVNRPMVLVAAGGIGAGGLESASRVLASLPEPPVVVTVCGRNDAAYHRLTRRPVAKDSVALRRVPAECMARWMRAADILVGKPGGLTVSEALVVGVPFVVFRPFMIPGQEDDNARFLVEQGIGCLAHQREDLATVVSGLLSDPARRLVMGVTAQRFGRPNAAKDIADSVIRLAQTRPNSIPLGPSHAVQTGSPSTEQTLS